MDARHADAVETYHRLGRALIAASVLALAGWGGLWFRWHDRWIAFVVWGVGNGLAVIIVLALAFLRCPRCQRRGFGTSSKAKACRYCGLEKE
jgi:cyanate permease